MGLPLFFPEQLLAHGAVVDHLMSIVFPDAFAGGGSEVQSEQVGGGSIGHGKLFDDEPLTSGDYFVSKYLVGHQNGVIEVNS